MPVPPSKSPQDLTIARAQLLLNTITRNIKLIISGSDTFASDSSRISLVASLMIIQFDILDTNDDFDVLSNVYFGADAIKSIFCCRGLHFESLYIRPCLTPRRSCQRLLSHHFVYSYHFVSRAECAGHIYTREVAPRTAPLGTKALPDPVHPSPYRVFIYYVPFNQPGAQDIAAEPGKLPLAYTLDDGAHE